MTLIPKDNIPSVVIWDMGGILFHFFTEVLVARGKANNWPLDKIPLGPTGEIPDPHYAALDRGDINEPEYVNRIIGEFAKQGIKYIPYKLRPPERPESWTLVSEIKKSGRRQLLLTNDASNWLGKNWWEAWPRGHFFEGVVDVTFGVRKPSPEPYLACLEKLNVLPEECIFIDDMHVNCAGAEKVGMQSYWYDVTDPNSSVEGLSARLGLSRQTKDDI